jgi:hypothetical protein
LSELEPLCRRAHGKYNMPQELAAKYERRSPLYAKGDPIFRVLRDGPQILEF